MAGVPVSMSANRRRNSIEELVMVLKNGIDAELVYERSRKLGTATAWMLSFERFYVRTGSYATLTIMLTENENAQTADIIGSGGGEGLFNISWGANRSFARKAFDLLQKYGFQESD